MANSVDPDQTAPKGAVCSGSTLFASILTDRFTDRQTFRERETRGYTGSGRFNKIERKKVRNKEKLKNERKKKRKIILFCFCCFTSHVNSYGHCGTVSSLNHTFS